MIDNKRDADNYRQLAEKVSQREERDERCRQLALSEGKSMAVVKRGKGDYQMWPLSICGKDAEIVYMAEYKEGNSDEC